MKKVLIFAVFTTALALQSFTREVAQPSSSYPINVIVYRYSGTEHISFDGVQFYNECTNELMTLSGSVYVTYRGLYNGVNSSFDATHINVQGIKAIGESGKVYVISGTNNIKDKYSYANGVFTVQGIQNERWTTSGGQNNFTISSTYSLTFDAYGNVTVKRDSSEVHCQ